MEVNIEEIVRLCSGSDFVKHKVKKENELRKQMKLCDLTIKINNKDLFKVHKSIIASSCDYFAKLIDEQEVGRYLIKPISRVYIKHKNKDETAEPAEDDCSIAESTSKIPKRKKNKNVIEQRSDINEVISIDIEIIPECFEIILEYLYTGRIFVSTMTYVNSLDLHKATFYFNLQKLRIILSKILQKFITLKNVLELLRHSVEYFDESLRIKCLTIIKDNSVDFLYNNISDIKFEELKSLCDNHNLKCTQEEIYEYFMKWIKMEIHFNEKYLKDLLNLIDFSNITGNFIQTKILPEEILFRNPEHIKKILAELSNYFNVIPKNMINNVDQFYKTLNIFLITNTGIYKIDIELKRCQLLLNHNINRTDFAVCSFDDKILISGGTKTNLLECSSECDCYNPCLNKINPFPILLEPKGLHKMILINKKVYAFGGYKNETVQIFDIDTRTWSFGIKMPRKRHNFALEEHDGNIYLMGGFSPPYGNTTSPTDIFNHNTNEWSTSVSLYKQNLKSIRADNFGYLFNMEGYQKYDFKNITTAPNTVMFMEKLNNFDIVKFHNQIFVLGKNGHDEIISYLIDIEKGNIIQIHIDFKICGYLGKDIHLVTA